MSIIVCVLKMQVHFLLANGANPVVRLLRSETAVCNWKSVALFHNILSAVTGIKRVYSASRRYQRQPWCWFCDETLYQKVISRVIL